MRMISREDLKQRVMGHFCGSCSTPYKDTDILELGEYCCDMVSDTIAFIDELPTIEAEPVHENPENGNKESEQYCHDCKHNEVCKYYPHNGCDFKEKAEGWIDDESMPNEDMKPDNEVI